MATRLMWIQEKKLQNLVKGKLSLLFKASVHGFTKNSLFRRRFCKGPTLIVIYSSDHVFGKYIPQEDTNETRASSFFFAFEETKISGCEIRLQNLNASFYYGLNEFWLDLPRKRVTLNFDTIEKLKLPQNQTISFEECEVFRCEG